MASPTPPLLAGQTPATCRAERVDFVKAKLPEYEDCFAVLIHDVLSPEECKALLDAAEATTSGVWEQAMVNIGGGRQMLITDTRNCGRIIWDDKTLAARLLDRIMPHLPEEIVTLKAKAHITGNGPVKRGETWRISRLNERFRFLKYTSGMYFRPHCDGSYVTPNQQEISYVTVHLYLNGDPTTQDTPEKPVEEVEEVNEKPLMGGATRFFAYNMQHYLDVVPETGSCLVFQHRYMVHSGEDVVQGTKYTMRTDVMYQKVA